ncbi:hypothetical protein [Azospirillum argentinense]
MDLIAGTSIGSIIAISPTVGLKVTDIAAMMQDHVNAIFPHKPFRAVWPSIRFSPGLCARPSRRSSGQRRRLCSR